MGYAAIRTSSNATLSLAFINSNRLMVVSYQCLDTTFTSGRNPFTPINGGGGGIETASLVAILVSYDYQISTFSDSIPYVFLYTIRLAICQSYEYIYSLADLDYRSTSYHSRMNLSFLSYLDMP